MGTVVSSARKRTKVVVVPEEAVDGSLRWISDSDTEPPFTAAGAVAAGLAETGLAGDKYESMYMRVGRMKYWRREGER